MKEERRERGREIVRVITRKRERRDNQAFTPFCVTICLFFCFFLCLFLFFANLSHLLLRSVNQRKKTNKNDINGFSPYVDEKKRQRFFFLQQVFEKQPPVKQPVKTRSHLIKRLLSFASSFVMRQTPRMTLEKSRRLKM